MSDSKKFATALLDDLDRLGEKDFGDVHAQQMATISIALAINELRKELRLLRENSEATVGLLKNLGSAADATAGFTADIAAHLVDPDPYDDEDYGDVVVNQTFPFPQVKPFDFTNLRIA